mgnify:FL=1
MSVLPVSTLVSSSSRTGPKETMMLSLKERSKSSSNLLVTVVKAHEIEKEELVSTIQKVGKMNQALQEALEKQEAGSAKERETDQAKIRELSRGIEMLAKEVKTLQSEIDILCQKVIRCQGQAGICAEAAYCYRYNVNTHTNLSFYINSPYAPGHRSMSAHVNALTGMLDDEYKGLVTSAPSAGISAASHTLEVFNKVAESDVKSIQEKSKTILKGCETLQEASKKL